MSDTVFVVEEGEYEQRGVMVVADSLDAAVAAVKRRYGPPYVVDWAELEVVADGLWLLRGAFAAVPGKSTEHTAEFDISVCEFARGENT